MGMSTAAPAGGAFSNLGGSFLTLQAIGGLTSSVGSYFAAQGQKTALNAQSNIDNINAQSSENAAQGALLSGQKEQQTILLKGAQIKSSQRASMAANGIDLGSDTAVNVQDSTDYLSQSDANTAAANAVRTAWGYRQTATNQTNMGLMAKASSESISPWEQAGSTLLTSAKGVAQSAFQLNKAGAVPKDSMWNMGF